MHQLPPSTGNPLFLWELAKLPALFIAAEGRRQRSGRTGEAETGLRGQNHYVTCDVCREISQQR